MSKLTLDLNDLSVESFSANGTVGAAQEPATGTMTYAFACEQNGLAPTAWTYGACCYGAGVAACTVKEPCCEVTP